MLKLFTDKQSVSMKDESQVTPSELSVSTTTARKNGNYVNLRLIIKDHSPLVLEHLDNEISNLKQKIAVLEEERLLVSKLLQVVEEEKRLTKRI